MMMEKFYFFSISLGKFPSERQVSQAKINAS